MTLARTGKEKVFMHIAEKVIGLSTAEIATFTINKYNDITKLISMSDEELMDFKVKDAQGNENPIIPSTK